MFQFLFSFALASDVRRCYGERDGCLQLLTREFNATEANRYDIMSINDFKLEASSGVIAIAVDSPRAFRIRFPDNSNLFFLSANRNVFFHVYDVKAPYSSLYFKNINFRDEFHGSVNEIGFDNCDFCCSKVIIRANKFVFDHNTEIHCPFILKSVDKPDIYIPLGFRLSKFELRFKRYNTYVYMRDYPLVYVSGRTIWANVSGITNKQEIISNKNLRLCDVTPFDKKYYSLLPTTTFMFDDLYFDIVQRELNVYFEGDVKISGEWPQSQYVFNVFKIGGVIDGSANLLTTKLHTSVTIKCHNDMKIEVLNGYSNMISLISNNNQHINVEIISNSDIKSQVKTLGDINLAFGKLTNLKILSNIEDAVCFALTDEDAKSCPSSVPVISQLDIGTIKNNINTDTYNLTIYMQSEPSDSIECYYILSSSIRQLVLCHIGEKRPNIVINKSQSFNYFKMVNVDVTLQSVSGTIQEFEFINSLIHNYPKLSIVHTAANELKNIEKLLEIESLYILPTSNISQISMCQKSIAIDGSIVPKCQNIYLDQSILPERLRIYILFLDKYGVAINLELFSDYEIELYGKSDLKPTIEYNEIYNIKYYEIPPLHVEGDENHVLIDMPPKRKICVYGEDINVCDNFTDKISNNNLKQSIIEDIESNEIEVYIAGGLTTDGFYQEDLLMKDITFLPLDDQKYTLSLKYNYDYLETYNYLLQVKGAEIVVKEFDSDTCQFFSRVYLVDVLFDAPEKFVYLHAFQFYVDLNYLYNSSNPGLTYNNIANLIPIKHEEFEESSIGYLEVLKKDELNFYFETHDIMKLHIRQDGNSDFEILSNENNIDFYKFDAYFYINIKFNFFNKDGILDITLNSTRKKYTLSCTNKYYLSIAGTKVLYSFPEKINVIKDAEVQSYLSSDRIAVTDYHIYSSVQQRVKLTLKYVMELSGILYLDSGNVVFASEVIEVKSPAKDDFPVVFTMDERGTSMLDTKIGPFKEYYVNSKYFVMNLKFAKPPSDATLSGKTLSFIELGCSGSGVTVIKHEVTFISDIKYHGFWDKKNVLSYSEAIGILDSTLKVGFSKSSIDNLPMEICLGSTNCPDTAISFKETDKFIDHVPHDLLNLTVYLNDDFSVPFVLDSPKLIMQFITQDDTKKDLNFTESSVNCSVLTFNNINVLSENPLLFNVSTFSWFSSTTTVEFDFVTPVSAVTDIYSVPSVTSWQNVVDVIIYDPSKVTRVTFQENKFILFDEENNYTLENQDLSLYYDDKIHAESLELVADAQQTKNKLKITGSLQSLHFEGDGWLSIMMPSNVVFNHGEHDVNVSSSTYLVPVDLIGSGKVTITKDELPHQTTTCFADNLGTNSCPSGSTVVEISKFTETINDDINPNIKYYIDSQNPGSGLSFNFEAIANKFIEFEATNDQTVIKASYESEAISLKKLVLTNIKVTIESSKLKTIFIPTTIFKNSPITASSVDLLEVETMDSDLESITLLKDLKIKDSITLTAKDATITQIPEITASANSIPTITFNGINLYKDVQINSDNIVLGTSLTIPTTSFQIIMKDVSDNKNEIIFQGDSSRLYSNFINMVVDLDQESKVTIGFQYWENKPEKLVLKMKGSILIQESNYFVYETKGDLEIATTYVSGLTITDIIANHKIMFKVDINSIMNVEKIYINEGGEIRLDPVSYIRLKDLIYYDKDDIVLPVVFCITESNAPNLEITKTYSNQFRTIRIYSTLKTAVSQNQISTQKLELFDLKNGYIFLETFNFTLEYDTKVFGFYEPKSILSLEFGLSTIKLCYGNMMDMVVEICAKATQCEDGIPIDESTNIREVIPNGIQNIDVLIGADNFDLDLTLGGSVVAGRKVLVHADSLKTITIKCSSVETISLNNIRVEDLDSPQFLILEKSVVENITNPSLENYELITDFDSVAVANFGFTQVQVKQIALRKIEFNENSCSLTVNSASVELNSIETKKITFEVTTTSELDLNFVEGASNIQKTYILNLQNSLDIICNSLWHEVTSSDISINYDDNNLAVKSDAAYSIPFKFYGEGEVTKELLKAADVFFCFYSSNYSDKCPENYEQVEFENVTTKIEEIGRKIVNLYIYVCGTEEDNKLVIQLNSTKFTLLSITGDEKEFIEINQILTSISVDLFSLKNIILTTETTSLNVNRFEAINSECPILCIQAAEVVFEKSKFGKIAGSVVQVTSECDTIINDDIITLDSTQFETSASNKFTITLVTTSTIKFEQGTGQSNNNIIEVIVTKSNRIDYNVDIENVKYSISIQSPLDFHVNTQQISFSLTANKDINMFYVANKDFYIAPVTLDGCLMNINTDKQTENRIYLRFSKTVIRNNAKIGLHNPPDAEAKFLDLECIDYTDEIFPIFSYIEKSSIPSFFVDSVTGFNSGKLILKPYSESLEAEWENVEWEKEFAEIKIPENSLTLEVDKSVFYHGFNDKFCIIDTRALYNTMSEKMEFYFTPKTKDIKSHPLELCIVDSDETACSSEAYKTKDQSILLNIDERIGKSIVSLSIIAKTPINVISIKNHDFLPSELKISTDLPTRVEICTESEFEIDLNETNVVFENIKLGKVSIVDTKSLHMTNTEFSANTKFFSDLELDYEIALLNKNYDHKDYNVIINNPPSNLSIIEGNSLSETTFNDETLIKAKKYIIKGNKEPMFIRYATANVTRANYEKSEFHFNDKGEMEIEISNPDSKEALFIFNPHFNAIKVDTQEIPSFLFSNTLTVTNGDGSEIEIIRGELDSDGCIVVNGLIVDKNKTIIAIDGNDNLVTIKHSGEFNIKDGANVLINDLKMGSMSSINMKGKTTLSAIGDSKIEINGIFKILLDGKDGYMPTINFGNVGPNYGELPMMFNINFNHQNIPEDVIDREYVDKDHILFTGSQIDCNSWTEKELDPWNFHKNYDISLVCREEPSESKLLDGIPMTIIYINATKKIQEIPTSGSISLKDQQDDTNTKPAIYESETAEDKKESTTITIKETITNNNEEETTSIYDRETATQQITVKESQKPAQSPVDPDDAGGATPKSDNKGVVIGATVGGIVAVVVIIVIVVVVCKSGGKKKSHLKGEFESLKEMGGSEVI